MQRNMSVSRILIGLVAAIVVAALGLYALAWRPAIEPVSAAAQSFDPELVRRGANLASLGDCNTCHTAPGGNDFAGGVPLRTPFGTIYSTNITPDPETGIGRWSEAAFRRAMREGIDREGRHLYPAFPFDHFTLVSDEDDRALYAFLMTRQAARAQAPRDNLVFPLEFRSIVAGWKFLFLNQGPFKPDDKRDKVWNRGAYLVQGLGHCGACHSPRNLLGAEKADRVFGGSEAEGWQAFPINAASPSPVPWDAASLYTYLRQGWHGVHGVAFGPMAPVTGNLAAVSDDDVRAIAFYVASLMGDPSRERREEGETLARAAALTGTGSKPQSGGSQASTPAAENEPGAAIYSATCTACHESGRPVPYGGIELSLSTAVNAETPRDLVNIILAGLPATAGQQAPIMPGFAASLDDRQMTALVTYLRAHFSKKGLWADIAKELHEARGTPLAAAEAQPAPGSASSQ